ncbi:MAG: hypothetical protein JW748_05065 [Anaerolineales bacterium]|nr:hypothetical protein [Anaerolineales bacterium]
MRRIFLVSTLLLVLACNLVLGASTPAQTALQGSKTPESAGPTVEAAVTGTSAPAEIVPVPVTSVQIEGMPYSAYQIPGDPFRFVCQDPCPHDPQFIYAEYAGFRLAHAMLIQLTGVDTLAELQPVDMHLGFEDGICRNYPGGHAFIYAHTRQAYTCTDGPGFYATIEETIRMAAQPEAQYFPLHEYMHTIFFGRISSRAGEYANHKVRSFHDFVNPIPSYAIGILDPAEFCSYHDPLAWGDFNGRLISELCRQNNFTLPDLALSLIELDKLYSSGGGQVDEEGYEHPVPTVAQYRDILNALLGSDTTPTFAAACWPPELFGNSYSLVGACIQPTISGSPTSIK